MATITQRVTKSGITYRVQVKVRDKGSGNTKVHSTTWKPPVGLTKREQERELEKFAEEFENSIKTIRTAPLGTEISPNITLSDYSEWWLKRRQNEIAASYYVNCKSAIETISNYLGCYKLRELNPTLIQQFYDTLDKMQKTVTIVTAKPTLREIMEDTSVGYMKMRYELKLNACSLANALAGKQISLPYAKKIAECLKCNVGKIFNVTTTKQVYAYETIHKVKRTLRAILSTAKRQRIINDNYASADFISFPKRPPRVIDYMNDEDAKKFYKAADECQDIRLKTATLVLLLTGIRRGELAGLEWQDINFEDATITIARSLTTVRTVGLVLKDPKTESSKRVIGISDKLLSVLHEYKKWYEDYKTMLGDKWINSNRVFTREYGDGIYPGTIDNWVHKICDYAGLPHKTVHSLRHTNITMQIAAGIPIVTVAGRAGHARTSTTTDIYSHFLKSSDKTAAKKLEDIFND